MSSFGPARLCPVAIVRKRLALDVSLYELLQILSVTLFREAPFRLPLFVNSIPRRRRLRLFDLLPDTTGSGPITVL